MHEEVVPRRLRAAIDEQARLTRAYEQSIGTTTEPAAYARLQAATLAVVNCDRFARQAPAPDDRATP